MCEITTYRHTDAGRRLIARGLADSDVGRAGAVVNGERLYCVSSTLHYYVAYFSMLQRIPLAGLLVAAIYAVIGISHGADDPAAHWAYQAITIPAIPEIETAKSPIDAFVLARLQEAKLTPSPEASPHTLLRRLHIDLTGLVPTPAELSAFESAWQINAEAAYTAKVDELLASPHFGERWARHWLDLARYADSDGYLGDTVRLWAWLYRDWVIDAINADQPFDQFSIEQLAGDLLPEPSEQQKIAAGFHRNNMKNTEVGSDFELDRVKQVVDRVATTGNAWLGLTVACAECHDHKHEAVSQKEFFELYAFFNNTKEFDPGIELTAESGWKTPVYHDKPDAKISPRELAKREKAATPRIQSLVELGDKDRRESFVHIRGDYTSHGDAVSPATLAVLHPLTVAKDKIPDRLDLAHWLFDVDNPLTPRVLVNRVWQRLFGVGIVSTSDDFGTHGAPPTHPQLLDWLAGEYRRLGWSRKQLIRTIVLSSTYRQSSSNTQPDLSNELLWRQNSVRVSAETVRDVHLSASGLLSRKVGGPGVYPPLPGFVSEVGRSVDWPESTGEDRYRRGIYILLKRTVLYPMLTAFDAPDTSVACSRRDMTNTPMQALTLLNDPVFFECAEVLGRELNEKYGDDIDAAITDLMLRTVNRVPTDAEHVALRKAHHDFLLSTISADDAESEGGVTDPQLAFTATARVVLNLDEFITRD